jgi:hypothetical protein
LKRIIVIESNWDIGSPVLQYALKAAKSADTEIVGVSLLAGATTLESAQTEVLEERLTGVRQRLAQEGVGFSFHFVSAESGKFMDEIKGLMPASLLLVGEKAFAPVSASSAPVIGSVIASVSIEALKKELTCPVVGGVGTKALKALEALDAARTGKKASKGVNWVKFLAYAIGSAIMYSIFYPKIVMLNEHLFMAKSVAGSVAIMAVVVVHAWVWGNTTHILPKMFKLE